jgi:predicted hydrocarbon binding protein
LFRGPKKDLSKDNPFDIDPEHGTITRKSDGIRVFTMGSVGWASLQKELASTFISGANVILQRMGYSYGRYLGNVAKARQVTAQEALESLQRFSKESGWGELVLNGGDLFSGQARLLMRNCIFCLHIEGAQEPVCNMLSGLIQGVAEEIIGADYRVIEEKCVAKGDAFCEVAIERVG